MKYITKKSIDLLQTDDLGSYTIYNIDTKTLEYKFGYKIATIDQIIEIYTGLKTIDGNSDIEISRLGREKKYSDSTWSTLCGTVNSDFKEKALELYPYFQDIEQIKISDTNYLDAPHFWASLNGLFSGHGDLCGWAGDLIQFASELHSDPDKKFPSGSFGYQDFITDLDSYNIYNNYPGDILEGLKQYYQVNKDYKRRKELFRKSGTILGRYNNSTDNFYLNMLVSKNYPTVTVADLSGACNKMDIYLGKSNESSITLYYNVTEIGEAKILGNYNGTGLTGMNDFDFSQLDSIKIDNSDSVSPSLEYTWDTTGNHEIEIIFKSDISINLDNAFVNINYLEDIDFSNLDWSKVVSMQYSFRYITGNSYKQGLNNLENIYTKNITTFCNTFRSNSHITKLDPLKNWDISGSESLRGIFRECSGIKTLDSLEDWDVSGIKDMYTCFYKCTGITDLSPLSDWDVSKVSDMGYCFHTCSKVKSLVPLKNWNTSSVEYLDFCFYSIPLTTLSGIEDWDTSKVTSLKGCFKNCTSLTDISALKYWDISKTETLYSTFSGCTKLKNIDSLKYWNTSNVTDLSNMLYSASSLVSIEGLKYWNTENVKTIMGILYKDSNISSLSPLKNWNTSKVTDMSYPFYNCIKLKSAEGLDNWDTSSVTTMNGMFYGSGITDYQDHIENWDTSNVTNMGFMFGSSYNYYSYNDDYSIDMIDLSNWDMSNVTYANAMFQQCAVKHLILPESLKVISSFMINHLEYYEDETFEIPSTVETIGNTHSLYNLGKSGVFKKIVVRPGNEYFETDQYGVLYTKDHTRLISIPKSVDIGNTDTYEIQEGVTFMGELSFSRVDTIKKIVLPDSFEIIPRVKENDPRYYNDPDMFLDTNYNTGNSLDIAIYHNTTIGYYLVKETNPRYISVGGCIYSKDGTTLIAVPERYNGVLDIADTCTTIGPGAFSENGDHSEDGLGFPYYELSEIRHNLIISEINIPASVIEIDEEQLELLNILLEHDIAINISSENTKYQVSDNKIIEK